MGRTQGRFDADTSYPDGLITLCPGADIVGVTAGSTIVRIAAGEFSLHYAAAAGAVVILAGITGLIFRTGVQDDLQEFFGSTQAGGAQGLAIASPLTLLSGGVVAGAAVNMPVNSSVEFFAGGFVTIDTVASGVQEVQPVTAIPDGTHITVAALKNNHAAGAPVTMNLFTTPAGVSGRPGFSGQSELIPVTAARPKGILLESLTVIYLVTGANLTVPTVGITKTQYVNNAAPVVTNILANAANGLQTAAQANPYVTTIPIPVANQSFITSGNTLVEIEMDANVGAATTLDVLGMVLTCEYNYD